MIIEGVPPLIVLRAGRDSAILEYRRSATAPRQAPAEATAPAIATAASTAQQRAQ
jgi:hypothetical protein